MSKYPSEIFGYYWKDVSKEATRSRKDYFCPFVNKVCYKKSRLVSYPFGVCTAHVDNEDIALCPRRFLDSGTVFHNIAMAHFGTVDNILVFSEEGIIMEKWKRRIFWVVQKPVFDYFLNKYRLGKLGYSESHSTVFALYDMKATGNRLPLKMTTIVSSTVDSLFNAFRKNDDIPPVNEFIDRLQMKVNSDISLALRLNSKSGPSQLDISAPTSSGRTKEDRAEYEGD